MDLNEILRIVEQNAPSALVVAAAHVDRTFLDYSVDQDPKPMDTIGNLIDKLCIVNNKMFFNQQWLYETRHESAEAFQSKWASKMPELHAMLKRCLDLNNQRSRLMDEIDQRLADTVAGRVPVEDQVRKQNKTY